MTRRRLQTTTSSAKDNGKGARDLREQLRWSVVGSNEEPPAHDNGSCTEEKTIPMMA